MAPRVISLSATKGGFACGTSVAIKKLFYKNNKETDFFDYLLTSMKSINEILCGKPIKFDNHCYNSHIISFSNFHHLHSIHDLDKYNKCSRKEAKSVVPLSILNELTNKYKRRLERLINSIKNEKKIYFVRYCIDNNDIRFEAVEDFFKIIKNINSELECKFILVTKEPNLFVKHELLENKNFYLLNLRKYNKNDELENLKDFPGNDEVFEKQVKSMEPLYNFINNIENIENIENI